MRAIRGTLILAGLLMGLWGLWLMRDFRLDQLKSAGLWMVGGIVFHDGVLAPLVVLYSLVHFKAIPDYSRKPATIGLILWGTITVAVGNVLSGEGGKPDNHTVLNRPYMTTWLILTLILAVFVASEILWRRSRNVRAQTMAEESAGT